MKKTQDKTARNSIFCLLSGKSYTIFMMFIIVISIIPLAFKQSSPLFSLIDKLATVIFIADYILRWITADYFLNKKQKSFILYPFTPMALVDLVSILPVFAVFSNSFRLFKIFRLFRSLRVFRVVKAIRYSKSIKLIINVFIRQKEAFVTIFVMAASYILISALVAFNIEPQAFKDFFEAIYWATISLTTVGYGDIYLVTTPGRIVTMISSVFGIAIVALPAGIITSGILSELEQLKTQNIDSK